jgi:hypothetical protein
MPNYYEALFLSEASTYPSKVVETTKEGFDGIVEHENNFMVYRDALPPLVINKDYVAVAIPSEVGDA